MKIKLLKKIIIGTGSVSIGAGIVLSAPGIINSSQNKAYTNKNLSDFVDFNQIDLGIQGSWDSEYTFQDKNGNTWVGTNKYGLWKSTNGSTFNQIIFGDGEYDSREAGIFNIFQDIDGSIWFGAYRMSEEGSDNTLWKSADGNIFNKIPTEPDLMGKIVQDRNGNIWIGDSDALGLWKSTDRNTFTRITFGEENGVWYIDDILQDNDGNIWVAVMGMDADGGLWKSTDGNTFTQIWNDQFVGDHIFLDRDGNIWVGFIRSGEFNGGLWKSTDKNIFTQIVTDISIYSIFQDKKGNIWLETDGGLWKSTDGSTFTSFAWEGGSNTGSMLQDKNDNIWMGTREGLWKSTDGNTFTPVILGEGSSSLDIINMYQDNDDNIWIGTSNNGLWKSALVPMFLAFTPESTHKIVREEDQTIYISNQSITLNILPVDQITIDGEIIGKTNETTQYIFDSVEPSPHKIEISVQGQHYLILVYIAESIDELNNIYDWYTETPYIDIFPDSVFSMENKGLGGVLNIAKKPLLGDIANPQDIITVTGYNNPKLLINPFTSQDKIVYSKSYLKKLNTNFEIENDFNYQKTNGIVTLEADKPYPHSVSYTPSPSYYKYHIENEEGYTADRYLQIGGSTTTILPYEIEDFATKNIQKLANGNLVSSDSFKMLFRQNFKKRERDVIVNGFSIEEETSYTFDKSSSPYDVQIINGNSFISFSIIIDETIVEEGVNAINFSKETGRLQIYLDNSVAEKIVSDFESAPHNERIFNWISTTTEWSNLYNSNGNKLYETLLNLFTPGDVERIERDFVYPFDSGPGDDSIEFRLEMLKIMKEKLKEHSRGIIFNIDLDGYYKTINNGNSKENYWNKMIFSQDIMGGN